MAPEKVTEMVLNVDLKCSGCYKKVKKVITKIPQITDQVFDVDKNKVKIKVVCCDPEGIRDKLCYKGCGSIQSIEIIEKPKEADKPKPPADKPKEAEKPKPAAAADKPKEAEKPKPAADKPKEAEKPKSVAAKPKEAEKPKPVADKPKEAEKPKPVADKPKPPPAADKPKEPEKPKPAPAADKPKEAEKPKPADKPKDSAKPPEAEKAKPKEADKPSPPKEAPAKPDAGPNPEVAKMVYEPVPGYPHMYPPSGYPMVEYGQHGYYDPYYSGVPYQHGYGTPPPPPPPNYSVFAYENEYNGYHGYHGNRGHYTSNDYGGEEDGEGCSIM